MHTFGLDITKSPTNRNRDTLFWGFGAIRRRIQRDEGGQYFVPTHGHRLGEKIRHVPEAGNVLHSELELANPILQPVESHVAGLRHFGLDGAIGEAHGDFIIAMNRRGRLRVAEVGEHLSFLVGDLGGALQTSPRTPLPERRNTPRGCVWSGRKWGR